MKAEYRSWYCIHTKPRMETTVGKQLMTITDIEVFSPKLKKSDFRGGRLREVVEDLFPCYIFSRFNPLKYHHLIKYTRGVKRILCDGTGNPYIVDDTVIDAIKSRMTNGFVCSRALDCEFNEGDRVSIQEGPLKGLTGLFLREVTSQDRILILLNVITYQAKVEISKDLVRA